MYTVFINKTVNKIMLTNHYTSKANNVPEFFWVSSLKRVANSHLTNLKFMSSHNSYTDIKKAYPEYLL